MDNIGSKIMYPVASALGLWLMVNFSAQVSTVLAPLFGELALVVAMIVLLVAPALVLLVLRRVG